MTPSLAGATAGSPVRARRHHGSHTRLLKYVKEPTKLDKLDAIIVPTRRPTVYLNFALRLAGQLGCPLVALCSQHASADQTLRAAQRQGVRLIATDVHDRVRLPAFATSACRRTPASTESVT